MELQVKQKVIYHRHCGRGRATIEIIATITDVHPKRIRIWYRDGYGNFAWPVVSPQSLSPIESEFPDECRSDPGRNDR